MTVHPRSRGEHDLLRVLPAPRTGSSPLARGTRLVGITDLLGQRFIPARAGNTPASGALPVLRTVHPRSRGEHAGRLPAALTPNGSSPLARGTRALDLVGRDPERFIPARAGNTRTGDARPRSTPVHPRSRGEHGIQDRRCFRRCGSSPLARGTRPGTGLGAPVGRFIPARAGNTPVRPADPSGWPVHPRSRGEHVLSAFMRSTWSGSSPLARGTPTRTGEGWQSDRFIPARAGNTTARRCRPRSRAVHPRSRGEHARPLRRGVVGGGSSPLARGTLPVALAALAAGRFIPARAGNTSWSRGRGRGGTVHPRSRGEHLYDDLDDGVKDGSSPLARGTHTMPRRDLVVIRFIPARAGNTAAPRFRAGRSPVHPRSRGEHRHTG